MYNNIFDSHAHYDDASFSEDLTELLEALPGKGISGIVNCATDIDSCKKCADISDKYDYIYFAAGIHPHEAEKANLWYRIIFLFLLQPDSSNEVVGLDYQDDLYFIYVICGSFGFPNIHQFLNTDPSKTLCVNHCIICNDSFLTSQLINRRPYKLSNEKILLS